TYTVTCNGETSAPATAFLLPGNKGDDIKNEICAIPAVPFNWVFGTPETSTQTVLPHTPWYVADLDNNGLPEILAGNGVSDVASMNNLVLFKDGNLQDTYEFNLVALAGIAGGTFTSFFHYTYYHGSRGFSRFSNGKGAVVALGTDGYIYAFEYDTPGGTPTLTFKYKSDQPHGNTLFTLPDNIIQMTGRTIGFADFDGDGEAEVYVGNKVFSLNGLNYLCGLPDTPLANWKYSDPLYQNCGWNSQGTNNNIYSDPFGINVTPAAGLSAGGLTVAVDLDYDGHPELICGGKAYKVTNTAGAWSMALYKSAPEVSTGVITNIGAIPITNDGWAGIADFNKDGHPDVLVSYSSRHNLAMTGGAEAVRKSYVALYAWDVHNDAILFADTLQANVNSYPFIGDVDGDGELEIGLTKSANLVQASVNNNNTSYDARLQVVKIPTAFGVTSRLTRKWEILTYETGCRTGMTVFDFNNDGKMEIVYRDMQNLRIMNAETDGSLTDLITYSQYSATTYEMPVIADIDGDGTADIVCAGGIGGSMTGANYRMQVFRSGSSPWAPSRNVWHQYAYNPTFVNEDLTVPVHAMNPATKFIQENGAATQPYNN
ncbi:FG-GAP repeat domain-containing protein, partial [Viscerimonas tarda]